MSAKADGEDVKEDLETMNFSWAIGAGYKLSNGLGFGARYNLGLSNIAKTDDSGEGKVKSNVIQIGLTYTFGGSAK
jgi:opacity protein-like surface antigen